MTKEHVTWTCGECDVTKDYQSRYDSDVPVGWFRLEDHAQYFVMCSISCLHRFVQTELVAAQTSPPTPEPEKKS